MIKVRVCFKYCNHSNWIPQSNQLQIEEQFCRPLQTLKFPVRGPISCIKWKIEEDKGELKWTGLFESK